MAAAVGILVLYGALATVPVAGRTGDEWLPVVVCWGRAGAAAASGAGPHAAAARPAPPARRVAGHGRRARPCRAHAHGRAVAARRQLRACSAPTSRTAGSARGPRCWRRWPARDRRCTGCSGWRPPSPTTGRGCARTSRQRRCPTSPSACTRLVRRAARPTWTRTPARTMCVLAAAGPADQVGRGRVRHTGPRGRVAGRGCWATPTCRSSRVLSADDLAHQLLRTYEPHAVRGSATHRSQDHWPMAMEEGWSQVRVDGMVARHLLGGRVAADRGAQRLPRPAPPRLGAVDARGRDGAARVPTPRCARSRRRGRRTWPTPSCAGAAASSRRPGTPASPRCWRAVRPSWRRAMPPSAYSGFVTVSAPSEEELEAACDVVRTRPARAGWRCGASTGTRRRPTPARCRSAGAWPDLPCCRPVGAWHGASQPPSP